MTAGNPPSGQDRGSGKDAPPVSLRHVTRGFGGRPVIRDITLDFTAGVFAITGPNGCGKSTLLAVMAGVLPADTGEVFFNDVSLTRHAKKAKSLLAYLPDTPCIYPFLTGAEFLNLVFGIRRIPTPESCVEMLSAFGLQAYLDTRFADMSLGTQRKFMLTSVLAPACPVLLLDEPCNALDSAARTFLIQALKPRSPTRCTILADHDQRLLQATHATRMPMESGRLLLPQHPAD